MRKNDEKVFLHPINALVKHTFGNCTREISLLRQSFFFAVYFHLSMNAMNHCKTCLLQQQAVSRWYNIPSHTFKWALVGTYCVLTQALAKECIMHLHHYSDTFYDVFVCIYLSGKEAIFLIFLFNSLLTSKNEVIRKKKNLYLGECFSNVLLFSFERTFFLSFFWYPAFVTCVVLAWWDKYPLHIKALWHAGYWLCEPSFLCINKTNSWSW